MRLHKRLTLHRAQSPAKVCRRKHGERKRVRAGNIRVGSTSCRHCASASSLGSAVARSIGIAKKKKKDATFVCASTWPRFRSGWARRESRRHRSSRHRLNQNESSKPISARSRAVSRVASPRRHDPELLTNGSRGASGPPAGDTHRPRQQEPPLVGAGRQPSRSLPSDHNTTPFDR